MSDNAEKMKCPNCDVDLDDFTSGKDLIISNGDVEIYTGRLHMKCCPECQYTDESTAWFG